MAADVVQIDISVKLDAAALAAWSPDRITALLSGIGQLIASNRACTLTANEVRELYGLQEADGHRLHRSRPTGARAVLDELAERLEEEAEEDNEQDDRPPAAPAVLDRSRRRPQRRGNQMATPALDEVRRVLMERLKPDQSEPVSRIFRDPADRDRAKRLCRNDPQFSLSGGGPSRRNVVIHRLGAKPQSPAAESASIAPPTAPAARAAPAKPADPLTGAEKMMAREQLGALLRRPGDHVHLDVHFGKVGSRPYKAAHFVATRTDHLQVFNDLEGRAVARWRLPAKDDGQKKQRRASRS